MGVQLDVATMMPNSLSRVQNSTHRIFQWAHCEHPLLLVVDRLSIGPLDVATGLVGLGFGSAALVTLRLGV